MKMQLAKVNKEAEDLLPPKAPDASMIGVNYTDTYIKSFNVSPEEGPKVKCKRKGLKIMFQIGDTKGEAVMDRLNDGPDPKDILQKALEGAAADAGARFFIEEDQAYLELAEA